MTTETKIDMSTDTENVRKGFSDFMGAVDAGAVAELELAVEIAKSFENDPKAAESLGNTIWELYAHYKYR